VSKNFSGGNMEEKKEKENFPDKKMKEDYLIHHPERSLFDEIEDDEEAELSQASKDEIQAITQVF